MGADGRPDGVAVQEDGGPGGDCISGAPVQEEKVQAEQDTDDEAVFQVRSPEPY